MTQNSSTKFFPLIQILPDLDVNGNTLAMVQESFAVPNFPKYIVPRGFIFDGASIPKALWRMVGHPMHAKYIVASCVHDYLYSTASVSRQEADFVFYGLMLAYGVNRFLALAMYFAVRIFGSSHYKQKEHA